jgi:hypothetical protein
MVDEPWWLSLDPRLLALLKYEIDPRLRAEIERCREICRQVAAYERRTAVAPVPRPRPRPKSKGGRPQGGGVTVASDRELYPDMFRLIAEGASAEAAALKLARANKVAGAGTPQSRATRLAKRFRKDNPGF